MLILGENPRISV